MKNTLKTLQLNKEIISTLKLNEVKGGGTCHCGPVQFTVGPLMTCAQC